MKGGKGWSERHSHTKEKKKKMLFSLKPLFPLLFPFFPLFQSLSFPDSLMLCNYPLSTTHSTPLSCVRHLYNHNEHKPKPSQHSIHFIVFLSCSFSLLPIISSTCHITLKILYSDYAQCIKQYSYIISMIEHIVMYTSLIK